MVEMHFSCSASNSNIANLSFRVQIDGTTQQGSLLAIMDNNANNCTSIRVKSAQLAAGSHTITAQWLTNTGTARIRPTTVPYESASLLVKELTV
jgi:hypothetical protein